MKKIGFHIGIMLLLFSCAKDLKKETSLSDQPDLKKELHQFFSTNFNRLDSAQAIHEVSLNHTEHINRFYQKTAHQLIWIDDSLRVTETAQKVIEISVMKNIIACEHCGRIIVDDSIVEEIDGK